MVLYAPAICPDCGNVFASDVLIAEAAWIIPSYRSAGGVCPRCGGRGSIPGAAGERSEAIDDLRGIAAREHEDVERLVVDDDRVRAMRPVRISDAVRDAVSCSIVRSDIKGRSCLG